MEFRRDLLGVRFVAEDGVLEFAIHDAEGPHRDRYALEVDVIRRTDGVHLCDRAPATWIPSEPPVAEAHHRRVDRLQVEVTVPAVGETYELMFTRPNDDAATFGDFSWVAITEDSPVAEMAVFPEYGDTPFGGMDWDWQEGWWYPYSTYHAEGA